MDMQRITRADYPEIIQAVRWMDEDNGTPHFEPGIGFVVDDPDGLSIPIRWTPHLKAIEEALAGLDHVAPHPLDIDTIAYLRREGCEPTLFDSAVRCFVSGEHTPVTAMATSSRELWIASRFLNERFEGWEFDPAAGYDQTDRQAVTANTIVQVNAFLTHMAERYRERTRYRRFGITLRQMSREDAMTLALATFDASQDMLGAAFGDPEYAWDRGHAHELVDEDLQHWEAR